MVDIRWTDREILRRDKETALSLARERDHVVPCFEAEELDLARRVLGPVLQIFLPDILTSPLCAAYIFRQSDQISEKQGFDGQAHVSTRLPDGRKVAALGVSVEALHSDPDYCTMVTLHELTHCLYGVPEEHGEVFHGLLDQLIARYNEATGHSVNNDYFGLYRSESAQKAR